MSESEREILAKYSAPGSRRTELTRAGKKHQLEVMVSEGRITPDEAKETLNRLYPPDPADKVQAVLSIIEVNAAIARTVLSKWISKRVKEIERLTGIPRELLRPDSE
jgi:hypothetical protein